MRIGRRTSPGVVAAVVVLVTTVATGGCGDGRPAFCDDLAGSVDMTALTRALDAHDLGRARVAAQRFRDLSDRAPGAIRSDMQALAGAVGDIVDLVGAERSTTTGGDHGAVTGDAKNSPDVEQDRNELNSRLSELSTVSSRVERWAQRSCGISLR